MYYDLAQNEIFVISSTTWVHYHLLLRTLNKRYMYMYMLYMPTHHVQVYEHAVVDCLVRITMIIP